MTVLGADGKVGGTVRDVWVDRSEPQIRYFEVEVGRRRATCCCRSTSDAWTDGAREVRVKAIIGRPVRTMRPGSRTPTR